MLDLHVEPARPFEPSSRQRALLMALGERSTLLAEMYYGALKVLADGNNPSKLPLSAHGIRELMEKLPTELGIKVKIDSAGIKVRVENLKRIYDNCKGRDNYEKYIRESDKFFGWFVEAKPRRGEQFADALRGIDPSGRKLPGPLEGLRTDRWTFTRDYFIGVAHHRIKTSFEEFSEYLFDLEGFLLDQLKPRTFEDFDRMESIIEAGESTND
ncbi:MAG: hypothetical protein ACYDFU_00695 [Nitrospirota bacterium]